MACDILDVQQEEIMFNKSFTIENLKDLFSRMNLIASVVQRIMELYLVNISDEHAKFLIDKRDVLNIPILDQDLIAQIKLLDEEEDKSSIYMALNEICSPLGLSVDIITKEEVEMPEMEEYQTPFIFTVYTFDSTDFDPDDRDDGDDDDPVGEIVETKPVMAMAKAAGR